MRDYGKIYTAIWRSKKFRGLPNDDCRLLYLYLHTSPHTNMVGCFVLDEGYALSDLGWTKKLYRDCIDTLSKALLVGFDTHESMVRLIGFIDHDPFSNPKHALAAVRMAEKLPNCFEKQSLMADLAEAKHVSPNSFSDTLSIPYRYQEPEPEPEQEPEPKKEERGKPLSSAKAEIADDRFDEFWQQYPHRNGAKKGKASAQKAWALAIKTRASPEHIIGGAMRYASDRQVIQGFAKDPATWLNQKGWQDDIEPDQPAPRPNGTDQRGARRPHDSMVAGFAFVADQLSRGQEPH